ncbi:covalently-linked cell wall protein [Massarina eburnea CBS 473.64]|uniref:Covalently-linked cell wall protein n=1 Tax=Massarina eburnea CBS 473.64 TaxID=1395130 RepID=A0A6A6RME9_9PLEO|nr:covalently-linked cell wall protein [Massarina eburnea CBS 473.64]
MKFFIALALAGSTLAMPQASSSACSDSKSGTFNLQISNVTASKRSMEKRQADGALKVTLDGGVLKDQAGRTGSIVANHQFQFDNPVQGDAIATSGFGVCNNGTITHDGSAIWYQCLSGTFYNLYDESIGQHCSAIYISAVSGSSAPVTQISDGQPGASTQVPISQISDGQPQAPTSGPVISQISDGQPQAPTGGPVVSQISDGQPQAPTGSPGPIISQISDGQPQAPTSYAPGPIISQISDGQPQAPTSVVTPAPTAPVVTQISDGQPQAPTGPVVTQISDGQPQAPIATGTGIIGTGSSSPRPTGNFTAPNATAPVSFPGAAASNVAGMGAFALALFAIIALL